MNNTFIQLLRDYMIHETKLADRIFPKVPRVRTNSVIAYSNRSIYQMPFWVAWQVRSIERYLKNDSEVPKDTDYLDLACKLAYKFLKPGKTMEFSMMLDEYQRPLFSLELSNYVRLFKD